MTAAAAPASLADYRRSFLSGLAVVVATGIALLVGATTLASAQQTSRKETRDSATSPSQNTHSDRRIPIAKERVKTRARAATNLTMPPAREAVAAQSLALRDTLVYRPDSALLNRRAARVDSGGSRVCCVWGALAFPLVLAHQFAHDGNGTTAPGGEALRFIPASLPTPRPTPQGGHFIPGYPSIPVDPPPASGNPTSPGSSTGPGAPNDPSDPGAPNTPANPSNPSGPSDPGTPGGPGDHGNPSDPGTPGNPNDPWNPGAPGDPGSPWTPAGPNTPRDGGTPWTPPSDPHGAPPPVTATPEPSALLMLASGFSMLGVGAGVTKRRRRSIDG